MLLCLHGGVCSYLGPGGPDLCFSRPISNQEDAWHDQSPKLGPVCAQESLILRDRGSYSLALQLVAHQPAQDALLLHAFMV